MAVKVEYEDCFYSSFRTYLLKRKDLYDIVYQIVHLIPDRGFYDFIMAQSRMREYQKDITELVGLVRRYHHPFDSSALHLLQQEYDRELKRLVNIEKKLLVSFILFQPDNIRVALLVQLIKKHRLKRAVNRLIFP